MKRIIPLIIVSLLSGVTLSVSYAGEPVKITANAVLNEKDMLKYDKAEQDFFFGEHQLALTSFLELIEKSPDDLDLNFYVGMCYYYMNEKEKAAPYLEKASENKTLRIWIRHMQKVNEKNSQVL